MICLLLACSVLLGVCKTGLYNRYAKAEDPDLAGIFLFNAVSYGVAAAVSLPFAVGQAPSPVTVLCAAAYALIVFSLQALAVAAMRVGPMSVTSLFISYGMIIPSLAGPLFWGEAFGALQAAGMAVMLLSIWMLREKKAAESSVGRTWMVMVGLCFLLSGAAGVIEKVFGTSPAKDERETFLALACSIMLALSVVGRLSLRGREKSVSRRRLLLLGSCSGAVISVYTQVNLTLAGTLDSLIYYPVANGGALFLTVFIAATVFHERPSVRRAAGFFLGLLSVVLLSLPL